jgi:hypothetical protein
VLGDVEARIEAIVSIPEDGPISAQIRAISNAIASLRGSLASERQARNNAIAGLDSRLGELSGRFSAAVDRLDAKLYDVGVDSLRLQIRGVTMVIAGTVLLGLLSLFQPASHQTASITTSTSNGIASVYSVALDLVAKGEPMDLLTFGSSVIGHVAWPVALLTGLALFRKQLMTVITSVTQAMSRIVRIRFGDVEMEMVAPQEVGEQEMNALVSILLRSPHSFQYFREHTDFNYSDQEFGTLIDKHAGVLERVDIISREEKKRKDAPRLPGMRLTREYRERIAAAAKTG